MTRKDFVALAAILKEHREELEKVDAVNMAQHGDNVTTNALTFSHFMSDVRKFCRERNPNFDVARFDDAVYGRKE